MPKSAARADSAQEGSGRTPVAWALDFETWARGSVEYAGVDSELRMRLTTLFFFLNRPTVAALMAVGSAMAAAVKDPSVGPSPDPEPGAAPAEKRPPGGGEPAARSGSGSGMPEAADEGGDGAADTSTASPSEAGDAGARQALHRMLRQDAHFDGACGCVRAMQVVLTTCILLRACCPQSACASTL